MIGKSVRCKRMSPKARLPEYAHKGDAGLDLFAVADEAFTVMVIEAGQRSTIRTGWAFEIPDGYVGLVLPRSGMSSRQGAMAATGVIDSGYRGEVCVTLYNHSPWPVSIAPGDKIGQMVIVPIACVSLVEVDELSQTDRGESGHGSTGR